MVNLVGLGAKDSKKIRLDIQSRFAVRERVLQYAAFLREDPSNVFSAL